jgi:hypothetical protein
MASLSRWPSSRCRPAIAAGQRSATGFFGVASVVVLIGASVFALIAASIVGYLLSRRLVADSNSSAAAESLRGGDRRRVSPSRAATK